MANKPKPVLVLLGEASTGKSNLVLRYVNDEFMEDKEPTIGAAFFTKKCRLEDKLIKFAIWDTAGQERFDPLAPMYYRNAQAAIVVYDVTKAASLDKAKFWVKELQHKANPKIVIALVGNKIDQVQEESGKSVRQVPTEEARAYALKDGLLFFETSAKKGDGVREVFVEIAKRIHFEHSSSRSSQIYNSDKKIIRVEKDEYKAFNDYLTSATNGDANGSYHVGLYYLEGRGGVEKDEKKALEFFLISARKDNLQGIIEVGKCYRNGIGELRNIWQAKRWYQKERKIMKSLLSLYEQDINIDNSVKELLNDKNYQLSWIPYSEFKVLEKIGDGEFATVYKAELLDKNKNFISYCILKSVNGSNKSSKNFCDKLKIYCDIGYEEPSLLHCYGISRHLDGEYVIVIKYAEKGSLSKNLREVSRMEWKKKLNLLYCIASDLESIHSLGFVHSDLHSGNILQDHLNGAYIADLGLVSNSGSSNSIMGVVPYVAPEVLLGQKLTPASDIYALGIIMTEITTGTRAFDGMSFNQTNFSQKICQGERPKIAPGTPDCYKQLAHRCMNSDPKKRPTAAVINHCIGYWLDMMDQDNKNDVKKQFSNADRVKPEPIEPKHHPSMYTSKYIKKVNLP